MKRFIRSYSLLAWILAGLLSVVGAAFVMLYGTTGFGLLVGIVVAIVLGVLILREPLLGLWLILFFLPFERIPSLDVAGITIRANFFFGLVTMGSFLLAWLQSGRRLAPNPIRLPIYLLLAVSLFSLIDAEASRRGILTFAFILFTLGFEVLVVNLLTTPARVKTALTVLWCSAAVVGIFGIYQFLGDLAGLPNGFTGLREIYTKAVFGFPRIQAFSGEPLYLGNYLLLPLSLLVATLLGRVKEFPRLWLWVLLALLGLVFILTLSRGAYLAGLASLLVIVVTLPRETLQPKHLLGALLIGIVALAGTVAFVSRGEGNALEEFAAHARVADFAEGESTQGRFITLRAAWEMWQESPILGIGLGNYGPKLLHFPDHADDYPIVNNEYVELLTETGVIGLLTFVFIILFLLVRSVRAYQEVRDPLVRAALLGTTAAFVGTLVQYNFFSTLYIIHVWVLIGLLVAIQNLILVKVPSTTSQVPGKHQ